VKSKKIKAKKRATGTIHSNCLKLKKKKMNEWKSAYLYDLLAQTDGQTESWIARYEREKKLKMERKSEKWRRK
jgi:hypothetical protein